VDVKSVKAYIRFWFERFGDGFVGWLHIFAVSTPGRL
jgi:hypothetical protein